MLTDRPLLNAVLKFVYFGCLVLAAFGAWLIRVAIEDPCVYDTSICWLADQVKLHAWVIPALPVAAGAAKYGLERFEQRWIRQLVHALLTEYRRNLFGSFAGPRDSHRVTLFMYRKRAYWRTWPWRLGRLPWSGWLVPIARSDHTTQNVRARFLAPDDARNAEGIAGQTWRNGSVITLDRLPLLTKGSAAEEIAHYCETTYVTEKWVRERIARGESLPRSLRGLPIEIDNRVCGAIVLESSEDQAFSSDPLGTGNHTLMFSSTLSRVLERARL